METTWTSKLRNYKMKIKENLAPNETNLNKLAASY